MNEPSKMINFPTSPQSPRNNGNGGGGGDKYLYEKVGRLEGEISKLATKEDVQKVKTDIANVETNIAKEIGKSKEWILHRVLIVILGLVVLAFLKPLLDKLIDKL